ncbi:dTDP-4-dehydrorhamnose reductase [Candidatus Desulfarcum epimagneticum]|uniref:dTDP-4-dehydrorhamnose reductase n=1 Tax=uncultured Desulfobacteraceae bacterium TaxID=218296 RepID=A0A484HI87_9BACT|nr:dTDP-4-dehydrorhamnose reductase [uncultured Desulfobacteraceae bacterium]
MRVLILGGSGMLGHELWRYLSSRHTHIYATLRKKKDEYHTDLFAVSNVIDSIDAVDFNSIKNILDRIQPEFVLNCVGITKRKEHDSSMIEIIKLNSLLPHELALWGEKNKAGIIHFSTDCVFDGIDGQYADDSPPNAEDLYGRTKGLGEVSGKYALTLRSSFIGHELEHGTELLEWFLSQTGRINGFAKAIYTGFTTMELNRIVEKIITERPRCSGIYNVSSEPITKYDLLSLIKEKLNLDIEIVPDYRFACDRSLDSTRFRQTFNYTPPAWEAMIEELA